MTHGKYGGLQLAKFLKLTVLSQMYFSLSYGQIFHTDSLLIRVRVGSLQFGCCVIAVSSDKKSHILCNLYFDCIADG